MDSFFIDFWEVMRNIFFKIMKFEKRLFLIKENKRKKWHINIDVG
jgi:hypothetical protein